MKRFVSVAAVLALVAAVGAAIAWRLGLIGRKPEFDDAEAAFFDDYVPQAGRSSFADTHIDEALEGDDDLVIDDLEAEVAAIEVDEPLTIPDDVPDALSDPEVPDAAPADDAGATEEPGPTDAAETQLHEVPGPEGSHPPLEDGSAPEGYPIKGNADSMKYHEPGSLHYDRTKAEIWFATPAAAEAAGYVRPKNHAKPE